MIENPSNLNIEEEAVLHGYLKTIVMPDRKTDGQFIAGMIGIVGSGKSTIARHLAQETGAAIVSSNAVRVFLRKMNIPFEPATAKIVREAVKHLVEEGRNVIIDSDFVSPEKREALGLIAEEHTGIKVKFIWVTADLKIIIDRIDRDPLYHDEFYTGAARQENRTARAIKIQEFSRRLPHHYEWESEGGGTWVPKGIALFKDFLDNAARVQNDVPIQDVVFEGALGFLRK